MFIKEILIFPFDKKSPTFPILIEEWEDTADVLRDKRLMEKINRTRKEWAS